MKKKKTPLEEYKEFEKELVNSYNRWYKIYEFGESDPFWSDGCNLNLVHNHILYYGKKIAMLASKHGFPLPDSFDLPLPPEVDRDYMARRDEIRQNAKQSLKIYESDPNFRRIAAVVSSIGNTHKASLAGGILRHISCLKDAIMNNDYVAMRRYENPELYLHSAKAFVEELKDEDFKSQLSLDSYMSYEYENQEIDL